MPSEFGQLLQRCIETPTRANIVHFKRRMKNPERAVLQYITWVEEQVLSDPRQGRPLCRLALRLSAAVHSDCLSARSFNILAAAHQHLEEEQKAKRALDVALAHSEECPSCASACLRFKARFLLIAERHDEAREVLDEALERCRLNGDKDGEGKILLYRCHLHAVAKRYDLAIRDSESALQLLDPIESPNFHSAALLNLTNYLSCGTQADAIRALELMPHVEAAFEGTRHKTVERAVIKWIKGLIAVKAGFVGKGESHLRSARTTLIQLGLVKYVATVTADLATLAHPCRRSIRSLLRETLRLDLDWGEIKASLDDAWESTRSKNAFVEGDPGGEMMAAILALRKSAGEDEVPTQCFSVGSEPIDGEMLGF